MPELLTTQQLAALWFCSQDEIRDFAKEGMPHIKIKKQYFYDLKACQAWYAGGWLISKAKAG